MSRDSTLYIEDILLSIQLIEGYSKNMTLAKLEKNIGLQDAIVRRIEIIGEAAKNCPQALRAKYPQVPWKEIAGMRDVIVHAYFGIKLDLVWNVVKKELPKLKKEMERILKKEQKATS